MLEIRHLKTLHALRESDSLVEAAERLHLTQSALSHQFKELEERLGMPLFVRKTKPVRFTSAGLRLLQKALDNGTVEPNDGDIGTILTCDGEHEGRGPDDIDAFCTELQGG